MSYISDYFFLGGTVDSFVYSTDTYYLSPALEDRGKKKSDPF